MQDYNGILIALLVIAAVIGGIYGATMLIKENKKAQLKENPPSNVKDGEGIVALGCLSCGGCGAVGVIVAAVAIFIAIVVLILIIKHG